MEERLGTRLCTDMLKGIMANLAWLLASFIVFCSLPGILRQPLLLAREKEHFGTFSIHVRLMVLKLASLDREEERKKGKR